MTVLRAKQLYGTWDLLDFRRFIDGNSTGPVLGFIGYGGWFELRGEQVVHHVDVSLYPEHSGTDLVRTVRWEADRLILSTEPSRTRSGRLRWDELTWQRLPGRGR